MSNHVVNLKTLPSMAESILDELLQNASEIESEWGIDIFDYLLQNKDVIQKENVEYYVEENTIEYISNLFSKTGSLKNNYDHYFYLRKEYIKRSNTRINKK